MNRNEVLYGRRYRIIVAANDGNALDVSQLRCVFKINKSMDADPNYSEVAIFNLATGAENTMVKSGHRVFVEAGYEGDQYGLIFQGNVVQPVRSKEGGTTYKLTLYSLDGDGFANNSFVSTSLARGQDAQAILGVCLSEAGDTIERGIISEGLSSAKLSRGKVFFGQPQDYLRQLAKSQNTVLFLNDGQVNFVKATDLPPGEVIELNPSSGLVGEVTQNEDGILVKSLLNPRININTLIHISGEYVNDFQVQKGQAVNTQRLPGGGVYKVIKLTHTGDTRGNDWYTDMECIAQPGYAPSLIAGGENYIF